MDRVTFETSPEVVKANELGFNINYDMYLKAVSWWDKLTIGERAEYQVDFKMELDPKLEVHFKTEAFLIYALYETYGVSPP